MRIVYLNPGAEMGGAETSLTDLLAALREKEPHWQLHLLAGSDGPLLEAVRELGVEAEVFPMPRALAAAGDSGLREQQGRWSKLWALGRGALALRAYGRGLRQRIRELRPDVVHATGFKMQVLAALYLSRETKVLWHIHDYVGWRPVVRKLLRWTAGRVRGAVVNSNSVGEDLQRNCPKLAWVRRLYNAVDVPSLCAQQPADLDRAAGAEAATPGTWRIGLVATYALWKGHATYLDALALLPRELPWRAYIIGGPIYKTAGSQHIREGLEQAIAERGLTDRVFLTGFLRGRGGIMRALDVVVHASTKPEPFGMVVVEAMAVAKPVIVSRAGGAAELFTEGETALGHSPGNASELARAMERLLREETLRTRLGQAGQQYAAQNFSRAKLAEELREVYRELA